MDWSTLADNSAFSISGGGAILGAKSLLLVVEHDD